MGDERNWDEEFWNMAELDGLFGDNDSEEVSNLEMFDFDSDDPRAEYLHLLLQREHMLHEQHQVMVNAFQAKTFMYGALGLLFLFSLLMSTAWSIWYWKK